MEQNYLSGLLGLIFGPLEGYRRSAFLWMVMKSLNETGLGLEEKLGVRGQGSTSRSHDRMIRNLVYINLLHRLQGHWDLNELPLGERRGCLG